MPAAASSEGTSTSTAQLPSTRTRLKSSIPTASELIPSTSTRPGPMRLVRREASCEQTTIASVMGRNASPASIGEKPSTSWRYSETKYHMANAAEPMKRTTRLAPLSARDAKIRSGTSGRSARRPSMKSEGASSARPTASSASVRAEPQPCCSEPTIP